MAFKYTDIEDQIVTRLNSLLPVGYVAIPMPEKENQFNVGKDKVLVVVAYADSTFGNTESVDVVTQSETVTILCNIKSSRLRGAFSISEALEKLKIALVGFKPSNLSKLTASKIEFDERNAADNYFSYNFLLSGKKRNIEVPDALILPLLNQVTLTGSVSDVIN